MGATSAGAAGPSDAGKVTCVSSAIASREQWQRENGELALSPSSPIIFRALRQSDLPAVMELHRSLFPVQYTESFFNKLFTSGYFCEVGVDASGEIITVATARVVGQFDASATPTQEAYIMTLGVRPSHRRRGLGASMMEHMLRVLRSKTRDTYVALHVKAANAAACAFYDQLGFECNPTMGGVLPNHYHLDGEYWHARRYTRPLVSPLSAFVRDVCTLL